jgi:hypothetical protein
MIGDLEGERKQLNGAFMRQPKPKRHHNKRQSKGDLKGIFKKRRRIRGSKEI